MPTFRRGSGTDPLPDGLYEDVVTRALDDALGALSGASVQRARLEEADAVDALTSMVSEAMRLCLATMSGKEGVQRQVALAGRILELLRAEAPGLFRDGETSPTPELLLSIVRPNPLGLLPGVPARPATALARSELFTNSERQSVVQQLLSEIASADRIDLLCAFIKWSGFIKFRDALAAHCRAGRPLRVLTTTYLGATDARAVAELRELGAEVHVSYEETPTRLHAKAWLFFRRSGLSTAYVGSSNLSRAALTDGLEWNVRIAGAELPRILEKFEAVFRTYWDDPDAGFVPFHGTAEDLTRLDSALVRARTRGRGASRPGASTHVLLDVHPLDYQRRMLEDLELARSRGHKRNLVVAATGTGKTVVAALDYARLRRQRDVETLLFIAHRDTLLQQSRETFRAAVKDTSFGELWVGGERPLVGRHVFASIQSLASAMDAGTVPAPDAFDLVIVDEVHHAPAETYARLLRLLRPKLLLGLTATPERMDDAVGASLRLDEFFDRPWASELRLWEAIDRQILVPFNYFAVSDGTDVRSAWSRGRYRSSDLSNLYTADHVWLERVAQAVSRYVRDHEQMRAVAFCVDVRHAELAARLLGSRLGLRTEAVTSALTPDRRAELLQAFAGNAPDRPRLLCVVDLLNEGVDIPAIDTLLMMRPTESATVFIQQLGRGLRRAPGKDVLTVLDFIGVQHDQFRFDVRYTALLGTTGSELHRALAGGSFPPLPAGCGFQLEAQPRAQVLAGLKRSLRADLAGLVNRLDPTRDATLELEPYLHREQLELSALYQQGRSWTLVREQRGFEVPGVGSPEEAAALQEVQRLVHVDDGWRLETLRALLDTGAEAALATDERARRLIRMLGCILFGFQVGSDHAQVQAALVRMPRLRWELGQLRSALVARSRVVPRPVSGVLEPQVPLHLHARYLTEEIAAAFDLRTQQTDLLYRPQQGVVGAGAFDLLLVTLDKRSKSKLPHLQYEDYALSSRLFHWESQAGTRRDSKQGRRHLGDEVVPLLFIRRVAKDDRGLGVPYQYVGAGRRVDDAGERPIRVTWELREADLPAELLQHSRSAVA